MEGQIKSLLLNELQAFLWVYAVKVRIQEKQEALTAFHRAYAQAVKDIRQDPSLAKAMIMKYIPHTLTAA